MKRPHRSSSKYALFLDGKKLKELISLLAKRGITHGKYPIGYNFLYRILTNRKYIGEYKFGDIVLPNAMPAIIDEETFDRVQKRIADNKKAPAMHRSEDDYLLTTRLFCGKCGAMMAGEIGTSHTLRQYRYYRCSRSKKHLCEKKAVKKDWIEDLVIQEVISLISDDGVLDDLAERIYQMQSHESNATLATKGQLEEVQKKLDNLAQAIAQGVFSSTTKKLLDDLEEQKQKLEIELFEAETRHPVLSKDQILHALCNYCKLDLNTKEGKQRLIDSFVNSIYLYDDHFIITFKPSLLKRSTVRLLQPRGHQKRSDRTIRLYQIFFVFLEYIPKSDWWRSTVKNGTKKARTERAAPFSFSFN